MPRWPDDSDDGEDDEDDSLVEEDESTIPCPHCRREILEDAERCPYCENYISREDTPPSKKPWWIILGVILCLYVIYRWTFGM